MYAMTAAHKTLPLPTYLEVTNLSSGKKIVVRVNDRGPFHGGRIIDLSYAAAAKLGTLKTGTSIVEIRTIAAQKASVDALAKPPNTLSTSGSNTSSYLNEKSRLQQAKKRAQKEPIFIQVGAFSALSNATRLKKKLKTQQVGFVSLKVEPKRNTFLYLVHVGPFFDLKSAQAAQLKLKQIGYDSALYDPATK